MTGNGAELSQRRFALAGLNERQNPLHPRLGHYGLRPGLDSGINEIEVDAEY